MVESIIKMLGINWINLNRQFVIALSFFKVVDTDVQFSYGLTSTSSFV